MLFSTYLFTCEVLFYMLVKLFHRHLSRNSSHLWRHFIPYSLPYSIFHTPHLWCSFLHILIKWFPPNLSIYFLHTFHVSRKYLSRYWLHIYITFIPPQLHVIPFTFMTLFLHTYQVITSILLTSVFLRLYLVTSLTLISSFAPPLSRYSAGPITLLTYIITLFSAHLSLYFFLIIVLLPLYILSFFFHTFHVISYTHTALFYDTRNVFPSKLMTLFPPHLSRHPLHPYHFLSLNLSRYSLGTYHVISSILITLYPPQR